ncbi:MAG: N-acetyl-gamma-glutamyl-phosphate reductase [Verrucomicrobiota bacterium]
MKTAIIGASGYSGEELVRLLSRHAGVELAVVTSRSLAGKALVEVMPQFRDVVPVSLCFTASHPSELAASKDIDVFFLALPHGVAAEFAVPLVAAGHRVIDLSADFRLGTPELYASYYGQPHPAPELLKQAAYVIPEVAAPGWESAPLIASPGCYPTSIITPLVPLLRAGIIEQTGIVVNSFSGVSGAGKKLAEAFLYAERNESAKAYGIPRHRHLSEIEEQLGLAADSEVIIQFNPHLAPMTRGIATTITVPAAGSLEALYACWEEAFSGKPFIGLLPSGTCPDTAHVVRTNRLDLSAVHDPRTGNFIITSAEDNLVKGASGQAVQIMNLWFGLNETEGLL